jgi:hypothetical protein
VRREPASVDAVRQEPGTGKEGATEQDRRPENQLAQRSHAEALEKLVNDIRKHAEDWLIDGYPTTSLLEPTKEQLLQVIDVMIERVSNMIAQ